MTPKTLHALIMGSVLGGLVCPAWAADQAGSSMRGNMTPASQSQAQAAPGSARPAASETVRGLITTLDLSATKPLLKLAAADGTRWTFGIDPASTSVWKEGRSTRLHDLKAGQTVEVRHAAVSGKDMAQSIRVLDAKPIAATGAANTSTPHHSY